MSSVRLKTPEEIATLREGGAILSRVLKELTGMVEPGRPFADLDVHAHTELSKTGKPAFLGYRGYPASVCLSRNEEVVHGIPGKRILANGDLLGMDIGLEYKGLVTDMAVSVPVGDVSDEARDLLETAREALKQAIAVVRPGAHVGDIGVAVMQVVEPKGYGIVRDLVGHGVGYDLHEDPVIPNVGRAGEGVELEEGLVIAIEPMITSGTYKVKTLDDGWTVVTRDRSLAAHFEHTVAVTKEGHEILTAFDTGFSYKA